MVSIIFSVDCSFLKPLKLSLLNNLAATSCLGEEYLSTIFTHIQSHTSLAFATSVRKGFSQYFEFLISKTAVLKFVVYSLPLTHYFHEIAFGCKLLQHEE